jgi:WD40 repeat protein/serine/threonine protein kinase
MAAWNPKANEIFLKALEIFPPDERRSFLDQACQDDSALRGQAEALLAAAEQAESFLESPVAVIATTVEMPQIAEGPGTVIGPYKLLEQIGEGGFGVVFMADQRHPVRRRVALKIIKPGMDTRQVLARFKAEQQALALMDHPNIARVLDAGATETGRPYFVMELVRGARITDYCDKNKLPVHERLNLFVQICHAVQHAHQKGIIHRDLKPSNVLVTLIDGHAVPKVIDFGVAKAINQQLTQETVFTRIAEMIGTPLYMSPEQAEATSSDIDTRSDIYSLGVLLYELLTGSTPIDNKRIKRAAYDEIRRIIREEAPPRPSQRISGLDDTRTLVATHRQADPHRLRLLLRGDLDWIVMKALEKDRTHRYDTASNFAADVLRYLGHQPIEARPPSAAYRFRKFARRNRVAFATGVGILVTILLGTIVSAWQAIRATKAERLAESRLQAISESQKQTETARQAAYLSNMQQAGTALRSGDQRRVELLLERQRPRTEVGSYQGGEWEFLWRWTRMTHRTIARCPQAIYFACLSPNGQHLATAGKDGVIRIYDLASSELLSSIDTHQVEVNGLAFSPDGLTLASTGDDGTIDLWRVDWNQSNLQLLRSIKAHQYQAFNVLYTRDGQTLMSAGRDRMIRLWDAASGRSVGTLEGHRDTAGSIALHPDGKLLASAGHDGEVIVWDLASRTIVRRIPTAGAPLLSVDFSKDGRLLAASTAECDIRIWRTSTWELANKIELLDHAERIAFMNGGTSIAAGDSGGCVHIYSTEVERAASGKAATSSATLRAWSAHQSQIYSLVVLHNSQELITAASDGQVLAWDLRNSARYHDLRGPEAEIEDIQFIPGKNSLAVSDGSTISLWDAESLMRTQVLGKAQVRLRCLGVSSDGSTLAAGGMGGVIRVYHFADGGRESEWNIGPTFNVHRIAVSPDGRLVAAIDRYNSEKRDDLYVSDVQSGKRLEQIRARECTCAAFSPDGQWLVASGPANVVTVWNVHTQQKVSELPGHNSSINCIVFHPLMKWVATASDDRLIQIWSTVDWRLKFSLERAGRPRSGLAISADGRTMASSGNQGVLTLWHAADEADFFQPMIDVDFSPAYPEQISFSSDGRFLACVLNDPTRRSAKRFVRVMKWGPSTNRTSSE